MSKKQNLGNLAKYKVDPEASNNLTIRLRSRDVERNETDPSLRVKINSDWPSRPRSIQTEQRRPLYPVTELVGNSSSEVGTPRTSKGTSESSSSSGGRPRSLSPARSTPSSEKSSVKEPTAPSPEVEELTDSLSELTMTELSSIASKSSVQIKSMEDGSSYFGSGPKTISHSERDELLQRIRDLQEERDNMSKDYAHSLNSQRIQFEAEMKKIMDESHHSGRQPT